MELDTSQDFVLPLRSVANRPYIVSPDPPPLPDLFDVEIPIPSVVESALPVVPQISKNLLTRIPPAVVSGKDYRARQPAKGTPRTVPGKPGERGGKQSGFRKAYCHSSDGTQTTQYDLAVIANPALAIWDLLFPLLKPPLRIDAAQILDFPSELYPFQIEGVKRLLRHKCFLLGDEMGTGKTVITSVALRILFHEGKVRSALIVCPKSVLSVWDTHLRDWASTLRVTVVSGSADMRRIDWGCPAHIYVVTYDTLRNDTTTREDETQSLMELASKEVSFDAIVLDEAHAVKNPSSGRTKAVRRISKHARYRWALTGTPIQNTVDDLRSIFDILRPSLFPRESVPVSAEEARRKIEPYFLRRRKQQVFPELPTKIRSDKWLELGDAQRAEYDKTRAEARDEFCSGKKAFSRIHVFALLQRLKQICNFAGGMAESPKTSALLEQVEEIASNEKKVLVFSQYLEEGVEKLKALLQPYGVVSITGKSCRIPAHPSNVSREKAVDTFQTDPRVRVFLGTTKTAGEGITLTAASYVIHFDHWWNPAVAWQAEDRAHRKGQTETVNVYSYWMTDTVEERIRTILQRKGLLYQEVIDSLSESEFDEGLTLDDLLEVLDMDRASVHIPESEARQRQTRRGIGELFDHLNAVDPHEFEHIVKQVFQEALGFANARVTRRSADGGIDVEATRVSSGGMERVVVQCKRMPAVGPGVARELLGVVSADPSLTKGFLVTSGRLTKACREFCQKQGRLEGVDGFQLAKWIHEKNIDVGFPMS